MPRFVILEHDHPYLHWDLMLENENSLQTWRLQAMPQAGTEVEAIPLGDHRLAYLEYEGPVSDGRGTVKRWDRGSFSWNAREEDTIKIQVVGDRVAGFARLEKQNSGSWFFVVE